MKVIPCNTKVTTIIGNVEGLITAVSIRFNTVKYEITYADGLEHKTFWLHKEEFKVSKTVKEQTIGFK